MVVWWWVGRGAVVVAAVVWCGVVAGVVWGEGEGGTLGGKERCKCMQSKWAGVCGSVGLLDGCLDHDLVSGATPPDTSPDMHIVIMCTHWRRPAAGSTNPPWLGQLLALGLVLCGTAPG